MYYRRKYKKKKFKKFDVHVLGYTESDLRSKILTAYNIDQLPDCKKCGAIGASREAKSGPFGLYMKCLKCNSNEGVAIKHDPKENQRFKVIEMMLDDYHKYIPIIKKNYDLLMFIIEKEKNVKKKFYDDVIKKYEEMEKLVRIEIDKIREKRRKYVIESKNKGILSSLWTDNTFVRDGAVASGDGVYDVLISPDKEKIYRALIDEEKKLYPKIKELDERMSDPEAFYHGSYPNYEVYYKPFHFSHESVKEIRGENFEAITVLNAIDFRNPNRKDDLHKIEEEYYNPLVKEKSEIEKMMNKIFKSSNSYIYVLYNHSIPGLYKVGWTERTPSERAKELSTTGLPEPFRVVFQQKTNLTMDIEKKIHKNLDIFRHRGNREFFKTDLTTIKEAIKETLKSSDIYD